MKTLERLFFYCPVCKAPYETHRPDSPHCGVPSYFLGRGEDGQRKAQQMEQKRVRPMRPIVREAMTDTRHT